MKFELSCLVFFSMCWGWSAQQRWNVSCKSWGLAQYSSYGRTGRYLPFSPRHHAITMPNILTFVNCLGNGFFCCDQSCGCEYFIVHTNGCGRGSMFGNQVQPTQNYAKHESQDHSLQKTNNEVRHRKLLKNLQSQSTIVVQQDWYGGFFTLSFPLQSLPSCLLSAQL